MAKREVANRVDDRQAVAFLPVPGGPITQMLLVGPALRSGPFRGGVEALGGPKPALSLLSG